MSVVCAVTRVACPVGTGDQDITTTDLGGLTPKAALFIVTRATSDGVAANHAVFSIGATDGTRQWTTSFYAENSLATTDTGRRAMSDMCASIVALDSTVDGEASFVSWITNGVRINWGNAPAAAYLMTVVLFAGTSLSAYVNRFIEPDAIDATIDIAAVGFRPDVLLLASPGTGFADAALSGNWTSVGVATREEITKQACWAFKSTDNVADSDCFAILYDHYAVGQRGFWFGEIGDWDANGFTCTNREAAAGAVDEVGYVALAFGGVVGFASDVIDTPTATGNQTITDPGFTPQLIIASLTQLTAVDTEATDGTAGSFGMTVIDADEAYCNSVCDEDLAATSNTQSLSNDQAIDFPLHDGAAGHVATFVSFDANGWTWNFSTTQGTAKKWWYLAIGEVPKTRNPAAYNELMIY